MVPLSSLRYFNPRSPRGERPARQVVMCVPVLISIHAPLAGSDLYFFGATFHRRNFNPRSPRGERRAVVGHSPKGEISIHAPLAGSDDLMPGYAWTGDISIHAPLAGSDFTSSFGLYASGISIHAPLAGSDNGLCLHFLR